MGSYFCKSRLAADIISSEYADAMFFYTGVVFFVRNISASVLYGFILLQVAKQFSLVNRGIMAMLNRTLDKLHPCSTPEITFFLGNLIESFFMFLKVLRISLHCHWVISP